MPQTKMPSKTRSAEDIAVRARSIRDRIVRIGIKPASYRIGGRARSRIAIGNDRKASDTHQAHLSPKR